MAEIIKENTECNMKSVCANQKIEVIQKRAIKWIFSEEHTSYGSHGVYIRKCREADLLPMSERFCLNDLLFLHKVLNNLVPVKLPQYLNFFQGQSRLRSSHMDHRSLVSSVIPNITLNNQNITSEHSSTNPFLNSFFYRVHLSWNSLPLEIREIESHSLFKSQLTNHLWKSLLCKPPEIDNFEVDSND